jgi:hypothetical protein
MSDGELTRLEVLRDLDRRGLTTEAAARLLGLGPRQVFRLLKAYRIAGAAGLISKRRGCPSNRRKPEALRQTALALIRERYWDFGPTLVAEKLHEVHRITLGRETLRLWMIGAGILPLSLIRALRTSRSSSAFAGRVASEPHRFAVPQCITFLSRMCAISHCANASTAYLSFPRSMGDARCGSARLSRSQRSCGYFCTNTSAA